MRAKVNDGAFEPRVPHHRHCNQKLAIEIATAFGFTATTDFAANRSRSFAFRVHQQRTLLLLSILILGEGSVNQARSVFRL